LFDSLDPAAATREWPCRETRVASYEWSSHLHELRNALKPNTLLVSTDDKACAGITARVTAPGEPHALAREGASPFPLHPFPSRGHSRPLGTPRLTAAPRASVPCRPLPLRGAYAGQAGVALPLWTPASVLRSFHLRQGFGGRVGASEDGSGRFAAPTPGLRLRLRRAQPTSRRFALATCAALLNPRREEPA
jgi:hypothetical protein